MTPPKPDQLWKDANFVKFVTLFVLHVGIEKNVILKNSSTYNQSKFDKRDLNSFEIEGIQGYRKMTS